MIGSSYEITIVELPGYLLDTRRIFETGGAEANDWLKEFLALHPESGDLIPDTGGLRLLVWPIQGRQLVPTVKAVYYFSDLDIPLFLLSLFTGGEPIDWGPMWRREMKLLVQQLNQEWDKRAAGPGALAGA